jgi:hypothetical protein
MAFDGAAVRDLFDKLVSHAQSLGIFQRVLGHEPKSAPQNGLWCAIWVQEIRPVKSSGMGATSGVVELKARVGKSFIAKPEDGIDPAILSAIATLMAEYTGNFTLGGTVRAVDLLGMEGTAMSAVAGYLSIDGKVFRVMEVTLPVIINDLWAMEP